MLHYLLQILIFQVLFLALYDIFHKKDTFFTWNRIYLIITPILSLVFPFIKIQVFSTPKSQVFITQLESVIAVSSQNLVVLGTTGPEQNPTNWWLVLYCIGAGISLFLLVLKFYKLNIMKTFSFKINIKNKKVITLPNSTQAFSFWNTIYLGDGLNETEKKQILIHEIVHVDQKHSLDQLYFEFLKVVLWWNPLIYINQSRITVLHEYIADAAVIQAVGKRNYIEQLLNVTFQTQEITFVNQFFNQSLIKKRILMLQKSKSKTVAKFKYLLLVPVITGILTYTSCSDSKSIDEKVEIKSQEDNNSSGSITTSSEEPKCPNQNAGYDKNLDNFLEVTSGKNAEVILQMVSTETEKTIRTIHLVRGQIYKIKHIPGGNYRLDIVYGEEYDEKVVDGTCMGYFKNEKARETGEDILNFNTERTAKGLNVPSYKLTVDLTDEDHDHENEKNDAAASQHSKPEQNKFKTPKTFVNNDAEPKCPNQNALYDASIDNFLKLTSLKTAEALVKVVSLKTKQSIRTIYLKRDQVYFAKNIPEDSYRLHIIYGDDYVEKTIDGICKAYFKNEKATQIAEHILDFTTIKTERGLNVPSYKITLSMKDLK